jgi:hypothetical protein
LINVLFISYNICIALKAIRLSALQDPATDWERAPRPDLHYAFVAELRRSTASTHHQQWLFADATGTVDVTWLKSVGTAEQYAAAVVGKLYLVRFTAACVRTAPASSQSNLRHIVFCAPQMVLNVGFSCRLFA